MFRYNAGREMTLFPKKHPYLPKVRFFATVASILLGMTPSVNSAGSAVSFTSSSAGSRQAASMTVFQRTASIGVWR